MIWHQYLKIIFKFIILTIILLSFNGCASRQRTGVAVKEARSSSPATIQTHDGIMNYELTDKSGKFKIVKESGHIEKGKILVVKKKMLSPDGNEKKLLEKSITTSRIGVLAKKIRVLRPEASQYTVWLDGEKFFSEMKIDVKTKSMRIRLESPEEKFRGNRQIKFPDGTGVFCFYGQLYECVETTSFFRKAIANKSGKMNFHIVWDGYPYYQEQYEGIPNELFTSASFEYEGETDKKDYRFSLRFAEQEISYLLSRDLASVKVYWISQGYSVIPQK